MKQLYIYMLFPIVAFSQSEKNISGQLICKDAALQGITILNLVTEKEAISNFEGRFSIAAKPEDLLVVQSSNFEYLRKIVDDDDFKKETIFIYLVKKIEQLEEVKIVNYSKINTVDLGIQQTAAKTYTTAERRLQTTGDFKPIMLLGLLGGSMPLDPIINAINGRTKRMKKYVAFEKIELRTAKLSNMFSDEYFIKSLKIPESKIKAFVIFAAEEESIIEPLRQKNKFLVSYALAPLAQKYLDLQQPALKIVSE